MAGEKAHISSFMITINQPLRFTEKNGGLRTAVARQTYDRLQALGDFMLMKKSIIKSMIFKNRTDRKTKQLIELGLDDHIGRIIEISPDREASIELGDRDKRLHLHVQFDVKHRTHIQLNIEYYKKLAAVMLQIPEKAVYVHISGATRWEGYKDYVRKGVNEATADFFDSTANVFSFQQAAETLGGLI